MTDPRERLTRALADRYRIERELGAGGMATVYLAEDLKHDRKVAVKVLKPELTAVLGADRFIQEIKTTASLQHPHILPLFDSGTADGFLFYVMPYIEGETLRDKLDRETQLGIDEAVRITREVADALDYAHRHGIIHRDIKPENILLHDGRPVVADFGIALAVSAAAGGRMTETGTSVGTPHYMSPEQATGDKQITGRADIYSLASVLYEMLAGEPPHTGGSAQAVIMKIIAEPVKPVDALRKSVPPNVAAAVMHALEKLPADRFDTARAFAGALLDPAFGARPGAVAAGARAESPIRWKQRLRDPVTLLAGLVTLASVAVAITPSRRSRAAETLPPFRFEISAPDSTRPISRSPWPAVVSRDGGMVVYSVAKDAGNRMFYLLRTDQLEARPIAGTLRASEPFFSPNGEWLAFIQDGMARKVRLDGSSPVVAIADGTENAGADWTDDDHIVFGWFNGVPGLSWVSAAGGEATVLTHPDTARGELQHMWPVAVPGSRTIVFTIWSGSIASSRLAITSLDDGMVVPLDLDGIRPLAVLDGMLVYLRADGSVMAVGLDTRRRRAEGRPIPVHEPVQVDNKNNGDSDIFVSRGGALVIGEGGPRGSLALQQPDGPTEVLPLPVLDYSLPRLSPDEGRIAVVVSDGGRSDVWIYDRAAATFSPLSNIGSVWGVAWSHDGKDVVYAAAGRSANHAVWSQPADGGSPAEELFGSDAFILAAVVSPDGRSLLAEVASSLPGLGRSLDLVHVALDSGNVARDYTGVTATEESAAAFSPDGRWVAYVSNETGSYEVYVRSFPDPTFRIPISVGGGVAPAWSPDGTRLYYVSRPALLAARVSTSPSFTVQERDTILASSASELSLAGWTNYQVARNGRILTILPERDDFRLIVSPNWITEFRQRVAESRASGNPAPRR